MKTIFDIVYTAEGQKLDLYLPECEAFPVFVFFHGGGLKKGDKDSMAVAADYLTAHGVAVVSANYRMYPDAVYPDFLRDAASAVAWTKQHIGEYGTCDKLYVGGSSAGAYMSMMLCFDPQWLGAHGIKPMEIAGFVHAAGQPTAHFNVLEASGVDPRRVIVDETAPLWHIGMAEEYPPMLFLISDDEMENRPEQTQLVISTLRHFRYDMSKVELQVLHGGRHTFYIRLKDDAGISVFGRICDTFFQKWGK